ncbi:MAG: GNAT family N-acetyltransferase [Actinomycetota bacterium]|nr:GNAT family N-acetyltransferase [Actinomycetota bacterium]
MADTTGSAEIVVLDRGQESSAAAALTASHGDYPAFRHVFPDARRRRRALRPFFQATVRDAIPFGAVQAAVDGPTVLAVAVWLPPGAFPWSASRKARATPAFVQVLAADPASFRRFSRYGANAERAHPREPHWYLEVLGVHPGHQRRGFGGRLVQPGLDRADQDGVPCYLETSDRANVAFYERFGFTVVEEELQLVPGGPTHVAMRRQPGG